MTTLEPAVQTQVRKSLLPMLLTWSRCISWTIALSALLAVLFALAVDGCARLR